METSIFEQLAVVLAGLEQGLGPVLPVSAPGPASSDPASCLAVAREIVKLLDTDLPGAMERIGALEGCLSGGCLQQDLAELKRCLAVFDIDSAHTILERLMLRLGQEAGGGRSGQ